MFYIHSKYAYYEMIFKVYLNLESKFLSQII